MLKCPNFVCEMRIAALRGCTLYKISPLEVGNSGSFCGLYLSLRASQALQISLLLLCGRVLQLGAVAAIHFMVRTPIPRTERYCPLSCISLTSWNSVLDQFHCSRARRHGATLVGRLPAVGPAAAVETAVWSAAPMASSQCESFTLFLSHHPSDATCDVTGCSPPSWWRSASLEAAASRFCSAYRCYSHLKVRDVPIYSLTLTDAL